MNNPPDFIRQFWRTVWRWIIRFRQPVYSPPFPQKKSEKGCLWGRGTTVHGLVSDGQFISSSSVKTANNKIPVSSVFNDSEGLYRTTICRCLVCWPHYSAQPMRFGSRVRASFFFSSDTPPKYPDRHCVARRRTWTRHGNIYRSVREKQGIVVYRQRVLQTVASLRVVSLVLRGHDISNINPQQEARFSLWKKLVLLRLTLFYPI